MQICRDELLHKESRRNHDKTATRSQPPQRVSPIHRDARPRHRNTLAIDETLVAAAALAGEGSWQPNWGEEGDRIRQGLPLGARLHLAPLRHCPGPRCFGLAPSPASGSNARSLASVHRCGPPAEPKTNYADAVVPGRKLDGGLDSPASSCGQWSPGGTRDLSPAKPGFTVAPEGSSRRFEEPVRRNGEVRAIRGKLR